jgi:hypothetical protein
MSWTEPHAELTAEEKLYEQLSKLPIRDHVAVLVTMALNQAHRDQIEPSFFKDIAFAGCRNVKHAATFDTLKFLAEQLEKVPESATAKDVLLIIAMIQLRTLEQCKKAAADLHRLVALLPSEMAKGAPDASK